MKQDDYKEVGERILKGQQLVDFSILVIGFQHQSLVEVARCLGSFEVDMYDFASASKLPSFEKDYRLAILCGPFELGQLRAVREQIGSHFPLIVCGPLENAEARIAARKYGVVSFVERAAGEQELKLAIQNIVAYCNVSQRNGRPENTFVNQFTAHIERLLIENPAFKIQDVCERMNVSHSTLYRRVREACKQTPNRVIARYRCEKAAWLLRNSGLSISEIAYDCGFSSSTYLSRTFKQFYGVTPSDFRKKQGKVA